MDTISFDEVRVGDVIRPPDSTEADVVTHVQDLSPTSVMIVTERGHVIRERRESQLVRVTGAEADSVRQANSRAARHNAARHFLHTVEHAISTAALPPTSITVMCRLPGSADVARIAELLGVPVEPGMCCRWRPVTAIEATVRFDAS